MASRSTNTLAELLQRFMGDIAQYKLVAPDDEMELIAMLEDTFLQVARAPIENMAAKGLTNAPPMAPQAGPPMGAQPQGVPGLNMVPGPGLMPPR